MKVRKGSFTIEAACVMSLVLIALGYKLAEKYGDYRVF